MGRVRLAPSPRRSGRPVHSSAALDGLYLAHPDFRSAELLPAVRARRFQQWVGFEPREDVFFETLDDLVGMTLSPSGRLMSKPLTRDHFKRVGAPLKRRGFPSLLVLARVDTLREQFARLFSALACP